MGEDEGDNDDGEKEIFREFVDEVTSGFSSTVGPRPIPAAAPLSGQSKGDSERINESISNDSGTLRRLPLERQVEGTGTHDFKASYRPVQNVADRATGEAQLGHSGLGIGEPGRCPGTIRSLLLQRPAIRIQRSYSPSSSFPPSAIPTITLYMDLEQALAALDLNLSRDAILQSWQAVKQAYIKETLDPNLSFTEWVFASGRIRKSVLRITGEVQFEKFYLMLNQNQKSLIAALVRLLGLEGYWDLCLGCGMAVVKSRDSLQLLIRIAKKYHETDFLKLLRALRSARDSRRKTISDFSSHKTDFTLVDVRRAEKMMHPPLLDGGSSVPASYTQQAAGERKPALKVDPIPNERLIVASGAEDLAMAEGEGDGEGEDKGKGIFFAGNLEEESFQGPKPDDNAQEDEEGEGSSVAGNLQEDSSHAVSDYAVDKTVEVEYGRRAPMPSGAGHDFDDTCIPDRDLPDSVAIYRRTNFKTGLPWWQPARQSEHEQKGATEVLRWRDDETLLINKQEVRKGDFDRLTGNTWLNDELINACTALILAGITSMFSVSTFFFEKLASSGSAQLLLPGYEINYPAIQKWINEEANIFKKQHMILPINRGNVHWVLAIITNVSASTSSSATGNDSNTAPTFQITTMDSMDAIGNENNRLIYFKLAAYIKAEGESRAQVTVRSKDIAWKHATTLPRQYNSYDCGVYVLAYLSCFVKGPHSFLLSCQQISSGDKEWNFNAASTRKEMQSRLQAYLLLQRQKSHPVEVSTAVSSQGSSSRSLLPSSLQQQTPTREPSNSSDVNHRQAADSPLDLSICLESTFDPLSTKGSPSQLGHPPEVEDRNAIDDDSGWYLEPPDPMSRSMSPVVSCDTRVLSQRTALEAIVKTCEIDLDGFQAVLENVPGDWALFVVWEEHWAFLLQADEAACLSPITKVSPYGSENKDYTPDASASVSAQEMRKRYHEMAGSEASDLEQRLEETEKKTNYVKTLFELLDAVILTLDSAEQTQKLESNTISQQIIKEKDLEREILNEGRFSLHRGAWLKDIKATISDLEMSYTATNQLTVWTLAAKTAASSMRNNTVRLQEFYAENMRRTRAAVVKFVEAEIRWENERERPAKRLLRFLAFGESG
ncbi:Ulp1 protease family, C-terminal catalytic domain containing protein [Marssonina coronariae]|uniref:Ulp1 protease family, C-terminal catalytic domain containing protein n=1 Tax=Diplocarpon coronariae TaxID=2795749 RepID=A0A218ZE16_9HELO|nr:Ulp1 protease family, C-terminal catalytic domain containing protein [Marssonina coronariae]